MRKWKVPYRGASEDFLRAHVNAATDDCIVWPYARNSDGYGVATVCGKRRGAHNWMCRLAHGEPFLIWAQAAHRCGNRACVNPRHLRWATNRENAADRWVHGTETFGPTAGNTKLNEDDVIAIRNAPPNLKPLAAQYDVSIDTIKSIRSGANWKYTGGPRTSGLPPMCRKGHVMDAENTRWRGGAHRECRACCRIKSRIRNGWDPNAAEATPQLRAGRGGGRKKALVRYLETERA